MTASNHTVTGALVAAVIVNPWISLPLAFLSHFVLDIIPHYGDPKDTITSRKFLYILAADIAVALSVLLTIVILQPPHWRLLIAGGVLAASPDLLWFPYWVLEVTGKRHPGDALDPVGRFLGWIQWCERPWGMLVETAWFVTMLPVLAVVALG